jgi:hypothetical protein
MRKDENARHALDGLERERPLLLKLPAATLPALKELGVASLRPGQAPFGTLLTSLDRLLGPANFFVRPLQELGEGKLDMLRDPLDLSEPLPPRLLEKGKEGVLMEPPSHLGQKDDSGERGGGIPGREVAKYTRLAKTRLTAVRDLDREQALV